MRITSRLEVDLAGDRTFGFQHAGLLMLDPTIRQLALCFGRGRLQNALRPIGGVPSVEIGGDRTALNVHADRLQVDASASGPAPRGFATSRGRVAAQEPTAMGGGQSSLAPLFCFGVIGRSSRPQAATLTMQGQKQLRIEFAR